MTAGPSQFKAYMDASRLAVILLRPQSCQHGDYPSGVILTKAKVGECVEPLGSLKSLLPRMSLQVVMRVTDVHATTIDGTIKDMEHQGSGEVLLGEAEFLKRRHWSKRCLATTTSRRRVFFVERDGIRNYPSFLADSHFDFRQVGNACARLGDLPGGSKWQFFATAKGSLSGRTPLQAIADGDFAAVMRSAEGFANR